MAASLDSGIVPAQVGFLAIYNPSLGPSDDMVADQVVYYASVKNQSGRPRRRHPARGARPAEAATPEERNEQLRQIGLAQAIVEFGNAFSQDRPVDTVETEKSRVILHELESGWWILASIDLTRLPLPPPPVSKPVGKPADAATPPEPPPHQVEYTSREVKSAELLLQDLLRTHAVFLLHHDSSLSALFVRCRRARFTSILGRYWDLFLSSWNVLLHGNPARHLLGGIKIAASGELGVGVGEEHRGSGERDVFEGLVGRIEGLVDVVVAKFDSHASLSNDEAETERDRAVMHGKKQRPADAEGPKLDTGPWLGTGREPGAEDGAIFLGVGALSRNSLRDVTYWMEELYSWGESAYGVTDSPTSTRPRPRPKKRRGAKSRTVLSSRSPKPSPDPEMNTTVASQQTHVHAAAATRRNDSQTGAPVSGTSTPKSNPLGEESESGGGGMDRLMGYLKLGYGTAWTLGGGAFAPDSAQAQADPAARSSSTVTASPNSPQNQDSGYFLIGLIGDVDEGQGGQVAADDDDNGDEDGDHGASTAGGPEASNSRTLVRTVTVELESGGKNRPECEVTRDLGSHDTDVADRQLGADGHVNETAAKPGFDSQDRNKTKKLRVVVYVNRPFIFTFLFQLRTDSLAWESLYRSLHNQLAPLRKPLLGSTAYRPARPGNGGAVTASAPIYDLVWDPRALTLHSTIPDIPEPEPGSGLGMGPPAPSSVSSSSYALAATKTASTWTRADGLNTHAHVVNMVTASRASPSEVERTCKTTRGWWIVWSRVMEQVARQSCHASNSEVDEDAGMEADESDVAAGRTEQRREVVISKEIMLIRKASDHGGGGGGRSVSASFVMGGGEPGWADGASRLAQGIGVDTRKYIEVLLNTSC